MVHGAVGEYYPRELRRFASGQTALNLSVEELADSGAMRRETGATRSARLSFSCNHGLHLLLGEAQTVRPPVRSLRSSYTISGAA